MNDSTIELIIDGAWGVYIPSLFATDLDPAGWGVEEEDIKVLKEGPEHEYYWETWDKVLNNASRTDDEGKKWTLHQDNDLFAVREDHEWDDEDS